MCRFGRARLIVGDALLVRQVGGEAVLRREVVRRRVVVRGPPVVLRPLRDVAFPLPRRDDVVEAGRVGFAGHAALPLAAAAVPILSRNGPLSLQRARP